MNLSKMIPYDLGVASDNKKIFIYTNLLSQTVNPFFSSFSLNGFSFKSTKNFPTLKNENSNEENTLFAKNFRISKNGKNYYLFYYSPEAVKVALSKNLIDWTILGKTNIFETSCLVPDFKYKNEFVLYHGDKNISVSFSKDNLSWQNTETLLYPRPNFFDKLPLQVGNIFKTSEGMLVFYYVKEFFREGLSCSVGAALFDLNDPKKELWRTEAPLISQQVNLENDELYPLGVTELKGKLFFYFGVRGKYVFGVEYGTISDILESVPFKSKPRLVKHERNPIIKPVIHHSWQSGATFNATAVDDGKKVHLVYRAMGPENTSVLGYATSPNGFDIDYLSDKPIYTPKKPFEVPGGSARSWFMSGGGYGGCEDPRITWIKDDKMLYLTYVAYNGIHAPRIAISSINENEFFSKNWNFKPAKLISKPNVVDKNAALFPEKIKNKYAILHRIFPNILIDFLDDLEFKNPRYLKGEYKIQPTINGWDSRKIGAGPPPIKTDSGWLLIYHAVDDKNDSQYKIGAMLLDLNEPWKVLFRTTRPILEPDQWYENEGFKSGVAYPCGAVVKNGILYVYYGGADKFICVATKELNEFIKELKTYHPEKMQKSWKSQMVLKHYA